MLLDSQSLLRAAPPTASGELLRPADAAPYAAEALLRPAAEPEAQKRTPWWRRWRR